MNIRQILLAGATVILLATSNAWAAPGGTRGKNPDTPPGQVKKRVAVAPEIDAASGTSAIALLTGVLLLVGERSRSRRS